MGVHQLHLSDTPTAITPHPPSSRRPITERGDSGSAEEAREERQAAKEGNFCCFTSALSSFHRY